MMSLLNFSAAVEVGIEHCHRRDAVDRQVAILRGGTNRVGGRTVVDAVRLLQIVADVRVDPGDAALRVALDDAGAGDGALIGERDAEPVRKGSLDHETLHWVCSWASPS